jgi:hypothetical protein
MYKRLGLSLGGCQRKRKMNDKLAEAIVLLNIESRKLQELSAASNQEAQIKKKLIEIMLIACNGLEQLK